MLIKGQRLEQLLTYELTNWSRQTCIRLAVACKNRPILAHPCAQIILGDLWPGGLQTTAVTQSFLGALFRILRLKSV